MGSERTGPDLSQEGGEHPDDWHMAHYVNPRFTRPESIMPAFLFLGMDKIRALIAYKQSLGYKNADFRVARQKYWKEKAVAAYEAGPEQNVNWLHSMVPEPWRNLPNPYPSSKGSLTPGTQDLSKLLHQLSWARSATGWDRPSRSCIPRPSISPC